MKKARITEPIGPIYFKSGPSGVLMLHGFTATPHSFKYMATAFAEAGYTVSVPLLAGHGTTAEDMEKTTWQDWYQSVERAYQILAQQCQSIRVIGLSMGGVLALHLAHNHRSIKALGLLATPIFLEGWLLKFLFPLLWHTPLRYLYRFQKKRAVSINDPAERRRHQTYDKIPVASVANLLELQALVRSELHEISQPTFIAHAIKDSTAPYANMEYIRACLNSKEVETLTLEKSDHIITVDYDHELVTKRLLKFFKKWG